MPYQDVFVLIQLLFVNLQGFLQFLAERFVLTYRIEVSYNLLSLRCYFYNVLTNVVNNGGVVDLWINLPIVDFFKA